MPEQAPGPGEALVRQTAVGLNYADVYQRTGLYKVQVPAVIGSEGAGVVEAVGPGVTTVKVGDRVVYQGVAGAYADVRLVPAERLLRIPREHRRPDRGRRLPQGRHRLLPAPPDVQGGEGDDDAVPRRGGRCRADRLPVGGGAGGHRHRHGRIGRQGGTRQGQRLHARHQLCAREFRRAREGDHRRGGGRRGLRRGGQGHLPGVARLPAATWHVGIVRQFVGAGAAVRPRSS